MLQVVTFNVLAPCWAHPDYYPDEGIPYLNKEYRKKKIRKTLENLVPTTDIFCLQETTSDLFYHLQKALPHFIGIQVYHDSDYWSKHITEDPPWEPNGLTLFIKKDLVITNAFELKNVTGNHSLYVEVIYRNKKLGIVCLHLDSDSHENRNNELRAILEFVNKRDVNGVVIGGDFNSVYPLFLNEEGFIDLLHTVGNSCRTCPESSCHSIIDHLVVRGVTAEDGDVLDNYLWEFYPGDSVARVILNLQMTGSDHFPVWGRFSV